MGRYMLSFLFICLVMITGCATVTPEQRKYSCSQYHSSLYCLYTGSATAFYNKLESDLRVSTDKHIEQLGLIDEIVKTQDKSKIPQVFDLLRSVENLTDDYRGKEDLMKASRQLNAFSAASDAYVFVISKTAEMRIAIGGMYAKLGDKDKAKEMYRNVVVSYTGTAYRSYVKKAEFALDDLK